MFDRNALLCNFIPRFFLKMLEFKSEYGVVGSYCKCFMCVSYSKVNNKKMVEIRY